MRIRLTRRSCRRLNRLRILGRGHRPRSTCAANGGSAEREREIERDVEDCKAVLSHPSAPRRLRTGRRSRPTPPASKWRGSANGRTRRPPAGSRRTGRHPNRPPLPYRTTSEISSASRRSIRASYAAAVTSPPGSLSASSFCPGGLMYIWTHFSLAPGSTMYGSMKCMMHFTGPSSFAKVAPSPPKMPSSK